MEEITLKFIDYSEEEADTFMEEFIRPIQRCGGADHHPVRTLWLTDS